MRGLQVAIDGPAGAGKSTVARAVARRLGYTYIDTGAMYRAIALKVMETGCDLSDEEALARLAEETTVALRSDAPGQPPRVLLDGRDVTGLIRTPEVSAAAARVARSAGVRRRLVELQRQMAARGGVVMDGRDIGTVVLPHADVKIFLTATLEERAARRQAEMAARGDTASIDEVKAEILARDELDEKRTHSPLRPADDAVLIDSTGKSVEAVIEAVCEICRHKMR